MRYWTADLHLGHENIVGFDDRPWDNVELMNEGLIKNWNETVGPADEVWIAGDFVLGQIAHTLKYGWRLNGRKVLIPGNHDRCHPMHGAKHQPWVELYKQNGFDEILLPTVTDLAVRTRVGDHDVQVCHLPYRGDSHVNDRFSAWRPDDDGSFLIHGHVHTGWVRNGRQINVGVSVWDYKPVPEEWLIDMLDQASVA